MMIRYYKPGCGQMVKRNPFSDDASENMHVREHSRKALKPTAKNHLF